MEERKRVKYVELNDFRAYKGWKDFDFTIRSGKAADLVVIYAPNGAGKTSFFDAIEWGLTGEINRLENDIGDKNYQGYILKNRDSVEKKKADVKIVLENEESIYRKSRKLTDKQTHDYSKGNKTPNGHEIFKYKEWKSLILSHNRIESFVKDNTGTKKYEDWGSYWDSTGQDRKQLEFIYKMKKQACSAIEKSKLGIEEKEKKLKEFEDTSDLINNINEYIRNYNELVIEKEKISHLNLSFTNAEYSIFINQIESKKDYFEKEKQKLETALESLNLLNKNFLIEFEKDKKDLAQNKFLFSSWSKIVLKVKDKLGYIENYNILNKNLTMNNENLERFLEIYNAGEQWFKQYDEYNKMKIFVKSMLDKHRELDKQIRYFEEQKEKSNEKHAVHLLENNLEEKKIKLNEYASKINRVKLKKEINEKRLTKVANLNDEVDRLIGTLKFIKDDAQNLIIDKINDFILMQIVVTPLILENKENVTAKLNELIVKKKEIERNILIEKGKYETAEQLSNEISEAIKITRNYIKTNNSKVCPVCNKEYKSMEELLSKTNETGKESVMMHFTQWNKYKDDLKDIDEEIEKVIDEWNKNVRKVIDEKNEKIINLEKKKKRIQFIIDNLVKKKTEYETSYEEYIKQINKIGYYGSDISQELIEMWYKKECEKKEKQLKDLNNKIGGIDNEIKKIKENLSNLIKEYEVKNEKCNNFEGILKNLEFIQILKNNDMSYTLSEVIGKIASLKNEINSIKKNKKLFEDKIKLLEWVDTNKISYYKYKIKYFEKVIKEIEKKYNEKLIYSKNIINNNRVTEEVIKKKKGKVLRKKERNNLKLRLINDIKFREEIKEYLNSKVRTENELNILCNDRKRYINTKEKLENIYDEAKEIIEKKITAALNTPLINDFYRKIEPHPIMKKMKYSLKFNDKDKPELEILVSNNTEEYLPDWYFSSAQLNVVALTTFLARANSVEYSPIDTIFIDDPVGHFDDINTLAFVDLLRAMIEKNKKQIIISTHDEVVYYLLKRKLSEEYYPTKFIDLGYRD